MISFASCKFNMLISSKNPNSCKVHFYGGQNILNWTTDLIAEVSAFGLLQVPIKICVIPVSNIPLLPLLSNKRKWANPQFVRRCHAFSFLLFRLSISSLSAIYFFSYCYLFFFLLLIYFFSYNNGKLLSYMYKQNTSWGESNYLKGI